MSRFRFTLVVCLLCVLALAGLAVAYFQPSERSMACQTTQMDEHTSITRCREVSE